MEIAQFSLVLNFFPHSGQRQVISTKGENLGADANFTYSAFAKRSSWVLKTYPLKGAFSSRQAAFAAFGCGTIWPTSKPAFAKLYTTKTPITSADLLNDRVLPFHEEHGLPVLRILTDRGTEYCGKADQHDYQLFLAINDIDHTKTKVKSPQTNGICERFHKTILQEFYQVTFRKKVYETIDQLQNDLDQWLDYYNNQRTHQGKICCGRTPMETLEVGKKIWQEKFIA